MNNNRYSKAERNDFEFDLLSVLSTGTLFGGVSPNTIFIFIFIFYTE